MRLLRRTAEHDRSPWRVVDEDPDVEVHADVYATPHVEEGRWGVFHADDSPVELAVERGGPGMAPLRQIPESPMRWADVADLAPEGCDYVYGGRFVHHFGHFIIETLARLWPYRDGLPPGTKIVMHGEATPAVWFGIPYVRAVFGALGLTPESFLHVDRPLRFDRLVVPGPAFRPEAEGRPAFIRLTRAIGQRLAGELAGLPRDHRPAYFAKTRLIGGVSYLQNEVAIVGELAQRGVAIVHPQEMPLAEHIRFIATRRVISGWVSSAHHVSVFAPPGARFSMLAPERPNSNFALLDRLTGTRGDYWFAEGTHNVPGEGANFIVQRRVPDPRAVAEALLETF